MPKENLIPISIAQSPRQVVSYDVATLPWAGNYRYFLQITDLFSKWIELAPMRDQTSKSIIEALETYWILRHGPPEIFLSDQGPNVDGSEIRNALQRWGINKYRSFPYHPQGDDTNVQRTIKICSPHLEFVLSGNFYQPSNLTKFTE